jgi:hypothetical protein
MKLQFSLRILFLPALLLALCCPIRGALASYGRGRYIQGLLMLLLAVGFVGSLAWAQRRLRR